VIDHVTIRVSDLTAGLRCYGRSFELLGLDGPSSGAGFHEWGDFSIAQASPAAPATRRLHVGFGARSREQVDAWWRGMTAAGHRSDGEPGPRPQYGPAYYGAFVLDDDGNSVEAVHDPPPRTGPGGIDHLWLRVRSLEESRRFSETIAPVVALEPRLLPDGRVHVRGSAGGTFSLVAGEPSRHVHLAFAAPDRRTVDRFHATAVAAGFRDNGGPGERPQYHPGYYGAFVLDPDGNNVEAVFHDRGSP
jgi:catechol 2,3-dioxygenase-like lactoylglutathione lyase family enzyme